MAYINTHSTTQAASGTGFFARIKAGLSHAMVRIQVGKMKSVLNDMSDRQLADIGVSRSEIDAYATSLIMGPIDKD